MLHGTFIGRRLLLFLISLFPAFHRGEEDWSSETADLFSFSFSIFSANSMEEIVQKLKQDGSPFATKQLEVMPSLLFLLEV